MIILVKIFLTAFFLNLLWEVLHSQLYKTCLDAPLKKYVPLIVKASLRDGFWITVFFMVSAYVFKNHNILANQSQLLFFVIISLGAAFVDENISLKMKRWEYAEQMPQIFGVGVTPLLELAVTGTLTFLYVFMI